MTTLPPPRTALALLTGITLLAIAPRASADASPAERAAAARAAYLHDQRDLMVALSAWSAGSIALGGVTALREPDPFPRFAALQFVAWGLVNGAIAGASFYSGARAAQLERSEAYWRDERTNLGRVFFINVALDAAYVAVGSALWSAGKTPALRGTGAGIVVQGGFLVVFDSLGGVAMRLGAKY